jgi:lipoprotein signal peptidase
MTSTLTRYMNVAVEWLTQMWDSLIPAVTTLSRGVALGFMWGAYGFTIGYYLLRVVGIILFFGLLFHMQSNDRMVHLNP